jgi:hypothetical protein
LRFRLPSTGEEIELEAALPEDLQSALDGIEGTSAKGDNA